MDGRLEQDLAKIEQNELYVAVVSSDSNCQYFVIIERTITIESDSFADAITDLICTYFVFDMAYPKTLTLTLLYI